MNDSRPAAVLHPELADRTVEVTTEAGAKLLDRYQKPTGRVLLTGVQALVRVLIDQARRDQRLGKLTAGVVSGYPGSPLGGLDQELERQSTLLHSWNISHLPGLNEDLAATSVFGTQILEHIDGALVEGVYGMWFGKAPGVDRSVDAFHHGNARGVARKGGVVAVAGDDPRPVSSTLPSDSTLAFVHARMPVLFPANVQEVVDLGLHAYALSRTCGLAVGLKLVDSVAAAAQSVDVDEASRAPTPCPPAEVGGRPYEPSVARNEGGAGNARREQGIVEGGLELARRYAAANQLNPIDEGGDPKVGLVAAGKTYTDLLHALKAMNVRTDGTGGLQGLRVLKLGMIWPIDPQAVVDFARGLDEIVVIEERGPFIELMVKDALFAVPDRPVVSGKLDGQTGAAMLAAWGELTPGDISDALGPKLKAVNSAYRRPELPRQSRQLSPRVKIEIPVRSAYFCSGCPHNRSLEVPSGSLVGAGIGCHIMAASMERPEYGDITGYTQMGGEGAQWLGILPHIGTKHVFQNMGDGTFSHSGSLAIRFALSQNANITFKILHNSAVAMTGGQHVTGGLPVADMAQLLVAEGVRRVVITAEDPDRYKSVSLGAAISVRPRDDLLNVERELAEQDGVTVLINDQYCAAELRRRRKRGLAPRPAAGLFINERLCEGCGDCGHRSNCLSVQPVDTFLGGKTRIDQHSCNSDLSCLLGDCPSFMSVKRRGRRQSAPSKAKSSGVLIPEYAWMEPVRPEVDSGYSLLLCGVGGTGVVTANQILAMAAHLSGLYVQTMDNTGASQKAGPVVSHLRISRQPWSVNPELQSGEADAVIAFDLVVASGPEVTSRIRPGHTRTVANEEVIPTGAMVTSRALPADPQQLVARLNQIAGTDTPLVLPARKHADHLVGDPVAANSLLLGYAYQAGMLPVEAARIEEAIVLNGSEVEKNLAAFKWGRVALSAPNLLPPPPAFPTRESERPPAALGGPGAPSPPPSTWTWTVQPRLERLLSWVPEPLGDAIRWRTYDLCAYQNAKYASTYVETLRTVHIAEQQAILGATRLTAVAAANLYRLMAYKDEYEVARLSLDPEVRDQIRREFGENAITKHHLHPPALRALGMQRKIAFGASATPMFHVLRHGRHLRGTRLDLFGRTHMRRLERELVAEYIQLLSDLTQALRPGNHERVVAAAGLAEQIRGYEDIKVRNVEQYRADLAVATADLGLPSVGSATRERLLLRNGETQ